MVPLFPNIQMYFDMFGVFCTINCYFEYRICILCIFLYVGTYFNDMFQHFSNNKIESFPRSANNCRTNYALGMFLGFGVPNGPLESYWQGNSRGSSSPIEWSSSVMASHSNNKSNRVAILDASFGATCSEPLSWIIQILWGLSSRGFYSGRFSLRKLRKSRTICEFVWFLNLDI